MKVFKYIIDADKLEGKDFDTQYIKVEHLVKVLSVEEQRGEIVLYCVVDDKDNYYARTVELEVMVVGTGHLKGDELALWKFVGTVKLMDGALMFHIFWKEKGRSIPV